MYADTNIEFIWNEALLSKYKILCLGDNKLLIEQQGDS